MNIGVSSLKTDFIVSPLISEMLGQRIMNPAKRAVRIALDENISIMG